MNPYQQENRLSYLMESASHHTESKSSKYGLQLLNILSLLIAIGFNAAAILLPLNGKTTQQLSDLNPTLFVPAGFTFSIWSVIYTLQLISHIIILYKIYKDDAFFIRVFNKTGFAFAITCLFNSGWILAWQYEEYLLSVVCMFSLLATLIYIYSNLINDVDKKKLPYKWYVQGQYSVYLAWICVASIANVAAVLVHYYWDGWGLTPFFWAASMMCVAFLLGVIILIKNFDLLFAVTFAWALFGISEKSPVAINHLQETKELAFYLCIASLICIAIRVVFRLMKVVMK